MRSSPDISHPRNRSYPTSYHIWPRRILSTNEKFAQPKVIEGFHEILHKIGDFSFVLDTVTLKGFIETQS